MKKQLLFLLSVLVLSGAAFGQCAPDPDATDPDGDGEIWPPLFSVAYTCDPDDYVQNVTAIVFPDTMILPLINCTVLDLTVNELVGLPAGFNVTYDPASQIFPGGTANCAEITASAATVAATAPGIYPLTLDIVLNLDCPVLGPLSIPDTADFGDFLQVADCGDCATLDAPANPITTIRPTSGSVDFEWSPVQGSIGYRISGGPIPALGALSPQLGEFNTSRSVPFGALVSGATYRWGVAAGCGPTGPPITALSEFDTFESPVLRLANMEESLETLRSIELFPVPATEFVVMQYETETTGDAIVTIYDTKGAAVMTTNAAVFAGSNVIRYDLDLNAGMYIMEVAQGTEATTSQFTIAE